MGFSCGIVGLPNVGQEHALQRALQRQARRPELSVLHHRAERRHRGRCPTSASRRWRKALRTEEQGHADDDPLRRHRRPGPRRVQGRGARQPVPRRTSARSTPSPTSCAASSDDNVTHVEGRVDPVADVATIQTELCLKDLDTASKRLDRARSQAKGGEPPGARQRWRSANASSQHLDAGPARAIASRVDGEKERALVASCSSSRSKPTFYVANVDEASLGRPRRQPPLARCASRCAEAQPRDRRRSARPRGADRRARSADRPEFLRGRGLERARAEPGDPHRLRAPRADHVPHRRARTSAARGRCSKAPRRRKPPA